MSKCVGRLGWIAVQVTRLGRLGCAKVTLSSAVRWGAVGCGAVLRVPSLRAEDTHMSNTGSSRSSSDRRGAGDANGIVTFPQKEGRRSRNGSIALLILMLQHGIAHTNSRYTGWTCAHRH